MTASRSGIVLANGIQIAFEAFGDPAGRPLLLVMGLGGPMLLWHPELCALLVVHGDSDPLIDVAAGQRTAELIEGAELLIIPGMGHDLPRQIWPVLADAVVKVADQAGPSASTTR